jgi:dipeptidase E
LKRLSFSETGKAIFAFKEIAYLPLMKNLLIMSTSTVHGQPYLSYCKEAICDFFANRKKILFIPFARPSGISHEDYTTKAAEAFAAFGFALRGVHEFVSHSEAFDWAEGVFTGGVNTFLLLKTLYETALFEELQARVNAGLPYMGTSAGSNIAGVSISTTNDMPIVYPPSFEALSFLPFNLNPHYLDPIAGSTHMGETRETRIREFHNQSDIPVLGLREGSWLRVSGDEIILCGELSARLFCQGKTPRELSSGAVILDEIKAL